MTSIRSVFNELSEIQKGSFPASGTQHPIGPIICLPNLDCLSQDGGALALLLYDLLGAFSSQYVGSFAFWYGRWHLNYFSCRLAIVRGSLTIEGD